MRKKDERCSAYNIYYSIRDEMIQRYYYIICINTMTSLY